MPASFQCSTICCHQQSRYSQMAFRLFPRTSPLCSHLNQSSHKGTVVPLDKGEKQWVVKTAPQAAQTRGTRKPAFLITSNTEGYARAQSLQQERVALAFSHSITVLCIDTQPGGGVSLKADKASSS